MLLISLLPVHMGLQLFLSSSPLSLFRALFLSYLAFSSLSPNNLFYLLSPTITPFLVIVSIPFFKIFVLFFIFHLMEAWGPLLCAGGSSYSHKDVGAGAASPSHQIGVLSTQDSPHPNQHCISDIFYISAQL